MAHPTYSGPIHGPPTRNRGNSDGPSARETPDAGAKCSEARRIAPNGWCHEVPALIGPFCCRAKATAFARPQVEFGHYEGQRRQVERWGGAFYVHVR